jgi:hypothetical protein
MPFQLRHKSADFIHKPFVNTIGSVWFHPIEPVDVIVSIHCAISNGYKRYRF